MEYISGRDSVSIVELFEERGLIYVCLSYHRPFDYVRLSLCKSIKHRAAVSIKEIMTS